MLKKLAVTLALAFASPALAASTTTTVVTTGAYSDLGAGPLMIENLSNVAVQICEGDSLPVTATYCHVLAAGVPVLTPFPTTSHLYAQSLNGSATVAASPLQAQALPAGTNALGSVTVNNPVGAAGLATAQASIGTTAAQIVAARTGAVGTGRVTVTIFNTGSTTVFVGASGVTTASGAQIQPGASRTINTTAAIFGIVASGTGAVDAMETY